MDKDKWIGLICIVFGVLFLWWSIKTWKKGDDIFTSNFKGISGGLLFIVIGIMLLIGKLHW